MCTYMRLQSGRRVVFCVLSITEARSSPGASQWAGDRPQRLCAARLGEPQLTFAGGQGKEAGRPLVRTNTEIRCP